MKMPRRGLVLGRSGALVLSLATLYLVSSCTEELPQRPVSAPTVAMAGLTDGDTLSPGEMQITAQVADDGCILFVSFHLDGEAIAVDSLPPFELTWDFSALVDDTTHTLQARARDMDDLLGASEVITFRVRSLADETPPSVAFTSPAAGSALETGLDLITVAAEDNVGIAILELSIDEEIVRADTLTAGNYPDFGYPAFTFNAWTDGEPHVFRVRAIDTSGNETLSDSLELTFSKPGALELSEMLTLAMPGWYNGHSFEHCLELDQEIEYTHTVEYEINASTCVRGFGAQIDCMKQGSFLAMRPARLDMDHCIIINGFREHPEFHFASGTIEFFPHTEGSIINCTFYKCEKSAIYIYETANSVDLRIVNNIFFMNDHVGIVRYEMNNFVHIRYNFANGHQGADYATHCGCKDSPALAIDPTNPEELHQSNRWGLNPQFERCPPPDKPPGLPCIFKLMPASPCIGTGEHGEDLGALPYEGK